MLQKLFFFGIFCLLSLSFQAQRDNGATIMWDNLLQQHVSASGVVDYKGFKNDPGFNTCISIFAQMHPDESWSKASEMAFWINVYNAFTVKLIVDNYPVKSIKDLKDPWDKKIVKLKEESYSLNHIEHEILRKKFTDPRIHFAINCASVSCPVLSNRAYFEPNLDRMLDQAARNFMNDSSRNKITEESAEISSLFDWFREDFERNGSIVPFINRYSKIRINEKTPISFMEYNWNLNGK